MWNSGILNKDTCHRMLPQVFFNHFACKNQLPLFCTSGTLVKNGLRLPVSTWSHQFTSKTTDTSTSHILFFRICLGLKGTIMQIENAQINDC